MTEKIAIVGGGIAGLTAAYLLNQKYDITLFERTERLGGNAYTYETRDGEALDIAVAAYSKLVSKNFLNLLSKLGVETVLQPKDAFLSVHNMETGEGLYLTPFDWKGLWDQKFALFRPKVLGDIVIPIWWSMHKLVKLMNKGKLDGLSLAQAIELIPELDGLRTIIMMSPLCLLSSMYYEEVLNAPAEFFVHKMKAFSSFTPLSQGFGLHFPKNLTRSYVKALAAPYEDKVVLDAKIGSVARNNGNVTLRMEDGEDAGFDKVVFACNADQALALLEKPTDEERKLLGPWKYKEGLMVVHKDKSHFPKRPLCQSWTCLQSARNGAPHFSVSCCCWRLCPAVSDDSEYFSTQHPNFPIQEDLVEFQKVFRTPIYDFASYGTMKDLPSLNGKMNSYYCGSHFGLGLHNDAVTSAIEVARHLGVEWAL